MLDMLYPIGYYNCRSITVVGRNKKGKEMTATTPAYTQIWSATYEWLDIATKQGFEVDYDSDPIDWADAGPIIESVGENPDDDEIGFSTLVSARDCDTLLRAGDLVMTTGPGGDVYFFRKV